MAYKITTTGTAPDLGAGIGSIILNDLGGRTLIHPTGGLDLELEFTLQELNNSSDLQNALNNGWAIAEDEFGNPIGAGETDHSLLEHLDVDYPLTNPVDGEILVRNGTSGQWENRTLNFVYNQSGASALWDITHNLKRFPTVTTVDDFDNQIIGDVSYISNNRLTISFSAAVSGKAYLT